MEFYVNDNDSLDDQLNNLNLNNWKFIIWVMMSFDISSIIINIFVLLRCLFWISREKALN
jgi:hypothetical protein